MKKRILPCLLISALLLTVSLGHAQQAGKVWRIGIFHVGLDHVPPSLDILRQELKALGYEEGKNLHVDWKNLPDEAAACATAQQYVRDHVDLIVAYENQTVRAARAATSQIPIIFVAVTDPVTQGFIGSWAHPGGNITGFATWGELYGKQLELFKEMMPRLRRLLVLIDRKDPATETALEEIRKSSTMLKLQSVEREVTKEGDAERVLRSLKPGEVDGVFIASPNLRNKFPSLIVTLAAEKRLPLAMYRKEWAEKGALFSYGFVPGQYAREGAIYIDKIFKGTKVGDLPAQQPPQLEFVINLKSAKALNLTIPPNVLVRADWVVR